MSPLLSRVSPLALCASLSFSSAAVAADINVPANTTVSGQKTFGGTDKVTVPRRQLTSSSNPTLNQTSTSTGVAIDNFGTIESTWSRNARDPLQQRNGDELHAHQ